MNFDLVFWGAIISVSIAVVIFGYLIHKVIQLMNADAEENTGEPQA